MTGVQTCALPILYLPALPTIVSELNSTTGDIQLTLSAFMLAFGFGQIFYGPAGDRFGRRPVILVGLVTYVLASAGCALVAGFLILLLPKPTAHAPAYVFPSQTAE